MYIRCFVVSVEKYDENHYHYELLPIVDYGFQFPFFVHRPYNWKIGDVVEVDFTDIVGNFLQQLMNLYEERELR